MKYAAELFGTFVLVFAGLTTANITGGQVGILGVALAFGLSLMAMAFAIGPISGCHINPAVTFGCLLSRRIDAKTAAGYWVSQVLGAIIACGLILLIAHGGGVDPVTSGFAANGFGDHSPAHFNLLSVFLAETFGTMLLVITVLGATSPKAPAGFAGIPIGLILTVTILATAQISNASINPARSIGPAVYVGGWAIQQLWVFILAPFLGGAIASVVYSTLSRD
ncbi:MAG TPA: aquaporin [Candidatus Saccharimonadales bacterium]|jgi:aquaporin Z|nr:aquaporin [Candidatus Saccharimonadales bacterium]